MESQANIPHKKREVFPRTFLHNVMVMCSFEEHRPDALWSEIQSALKEEGWTSQTSENALALKKGSSLFYLNDSNLLFSISSADYQSFESISAPMDCVDKTCRAMECKIKILALIKTNRYNVKHENNQGEDWMRKTLFSDEFNARTASATPKNKAFTCQANHTDIICATRFITKESIDTLEQTLMATKADCDKFKESLTELNDTLFDVWRWSVSENTVNLMRRKEK